MIQSIARSNEMAVADVHSDNMLYKTSASRSNQNIYKFLLSDSLSILEDLVEPPSVADIQETPPCNSTILGDSHCMSVWMMSCLKMLFITEEYLCMWYPHRFYRSEAKVKGFK